MLSMVRCTFSQRNRRRNSRYLTLFVVLILFTFHPSASAAHEEIEKINASSSNPTGLHHHDAPSSRPNLPYNLFFLLEEFFTDVLKPISQLNQFIYPDLQASRWQRPFLQIPNHVISFEKSKNPWRSASSQTSISAPTQSKQLLSLGQSIDYQDHTNRRKARKRHLTASVSRLSKRQQIDTTSTAPERFPQPFDTSLGTEFESDTCQPFMSKFLNNPSFQDCHPFSLLLTTSDAFFRTHSALNSTASGARKASTIKVKQVLDATCNADVEKCTALLNELAVSINSTTIGCGKDLERQNSLPLQALEGLKNYKLMREVACLRTNESQKIDTQVQDHTNITINPIVDHESADNSTLNSTSSSLTYCFEKAVSSSKPDDLYYYYLPLGTSLPSGTQPSCDECVRSIMKLYSIDASNSSLELGKTYLPARTMTNSECGPGFAPLPINRGRNVKSAAYRYSRSPSGFTLMLEILIFIILNALIIRV